MEDVTFQSRSLVPPLLYADANTIDNHYAIIFWYGIAAAIGLAAVNNIKKKSWSTLRLRAAAANRLGSTKRISVLSTLPGYGAALFRRISYPQLSIRWLEIPPHGTIILVVAYLAFVLILEFFKQDVPTAQHSQAVGLRAGWLTITQIPLLILLAGKVNIIGILSGLSFERLNVLHRWVSRGMLITLIIHFTCSPGVWYRDVLPIAKDDICASSGTEAALVLAWMNISTLFPIRNRFYEFFLIQHILTWILFIALTYRHLAPCNAPSAQVYMYIPIGLYGLDRILRFLRYAWNNIRPGRAILIREHGNVTKIVVKSRRLTNWTPGSFVLLSIPRFGLVQSHPATIASVPGSHDGELVFILRAHRGFTSRIYRAAELSFPELPTRGSGAVEKSYPALIDGPYGGPPINFSNFGTVVLIAGSTGITFTLPILLDLTFRSQKAKLPTRDIVFVWAVKTAGCLEWIDAELRNASELLHVVSIQLSIKIFVTADETFVEDSDAQNVEVRCPNCGKSESEGACGCIGLLPMAPPPIFSTHENERMDIEMEASKASGSSSRAIELNPKTPTPAPARATVGGSRSRTMKVGRPEVRNIIALAQEKAIGEIGVVVCGPTAMVAATRCAVAGLEKVDKGICLHTEGFGW